MNRVASAARLLPPLGLRSAATETQASGTDSFNVGYAYDPAGNITDAFREGSYTSESPQVSENQEVAEGDVRKTGPMGQK